jgi:hypothetical protein
MATFLGVVGAVVSAYVLRPGGEAATARFTPVVADTEGE